MNRRSSLSLDLKRIALAEKVFVPRLDESWIIDIELGRVLVGVVSRALESRDEYPESFDAEVGIASSMSVVFSALLLHRGNRIGVNISPRPALVSAHKGPAPPSIACEGILEDFMLYVSHVAHCRYEADSLAPE